MRSAHHLHGVLDMTPLAGFFAIAPALAGQGILVRLGDSLQAMLLEHLPRDGVNLHFGCHVALLRFRARIRSDRWPREAAAPFKPLSARSRSTCRRTRFCVSLARRAARDQSAAARRAKAGAHQLLFMGRWGSQGARAILRATGLWA